MRGRQGGPARAADALVSATRWQTWVWARVGDSGLRREVRLPLHTPLLTAAWPPASVWASVDRNEEGAGAHRALSWGGVKGSSALSRCCGRLQASCSWPLGSSVPGSGLRVPPGAWTPGVHTVSFLEQQEKR